MATAVTPHREEADAAQLVRTTTNDLRAEREFPVAPQSFSLVFCPSGLFIALPEITKKKKNYHFCIKIAYNHPFFAESNCSLSERAHN